MGPANRGGGVIALALASYEFAVVLPVLVFAAALLSSPSRGRAALRDAAWFTAPYLAVLAGYLAFRWLWLTTPSGDVLVMARASQWAPVGGIAHRVPGNTRSAALRLCVWPWFPRGSEITLDVTGVVTSGIVIASVGWLWFVERKRWLVAWWGLWAAAWFAPVVAASGFTDRFGYMGAAAMAGLVGGCGLLDGTRGWPRRAWLSLVLGMAVLWAAAFRQHAADWVEAGALADRVIAEAVAVEPGPAAPTDLHFVGVPQRERSALVLITYFPNAVWAHYSDAARANARLLVPRESVQGVVSRVAAEPSTRAARVYEWDAASRTFVLRFSRAAPGSP